MQCLDKLDEVVCAGEKLVVVDDQKALSFEWDGYGLKMEIPAHAAGQSGASPLEIGMVALISGQFEFPPGTKLVSGVYAIASSRKPAQPLLLLMEHCVDLQSTEETISLHFVRASCFQSTRPYKFECLDQGDFPISSRYGSIQSKKFSLLALVHRYYSSCITVLLGLCRNCKLPPTSVSGGIFAEYIYITYTHIYTV